MNYIESVGALRTDRVDIAFTTVPADLRGLYQQFSESGTVVAEQDRIILASNLAAVPKQGLRYGFAGLTRHTVEPAPPGYRYGISGSELCVETSLTYVDTPGEFDVYELGHPHGGHELYHGCSGAPVLSEEGDLVGLVVSGCVKSSTVNALPLRHYRTAVLTAIAEE